MTFRFALILIIALIIHATDSLSKDSNSISRVKRDGGKRKCQGKIVGGEEVKNGEFPWVVSIHQVGRKNRTQYCAGNIIAQNYILTAARCAYKSRDKGKWVKMSESEVFVVAGDHDLRVDDNEQKIRVAKFIFPPEWDEKKKTNDIALFKLESPIIYHDQDRHHIQRTGWNKQGKPKPGDYGHFVGWGTIQQNPEQVKPEILQVIDNVTVQSNPCSDTSENAFCAGKSDGNMCDGDEGGPYMCGLRRDKQPKKICGIASRPEMPDNCRLTAIYTDVSAFDKWLEKTTKE